MEWLDQRAASFSLSLPAPPALPRLRWMILTNMQVFLGNWRYRRVRLCTGREVISGDGGQRAADEDDTCIPCGQVHGAHGVGENISCANVEPRYFVVWWMERSDCVGGRTHYPHWLIRFAIVSKFQIPNSKFQKSKSKTTKKNKGTLSAQGHKWGAQELHDFKQTGRQFPNFPEICLSWSRVARKSEGISRSRKFSTFFMAKFSVS